MEPSGKKGRRMFDGWRLYWIFHVIFFILFILVEVFPDEVFSG